MDRRLVLFIVLSCLILVGSSALSAWLNPRKRPAAKPPAVAQKEAGKEQAEKSEPEEKMEKPAAEQPPALAEKPTGQQAEAEAKEPAEVAPAEKETNLPEQWLTLGSADPKDPYRMLVTLTSHGAAVARVEMNSPRYRDIDESDPSAPPEVRRRPRSGHLGYIVGRGNGESDGCVVQVVGPGTPAAAAKLRPETWVKEGENWIKKPGDVIKAVTGQPVSGFNSLENALSKTEPGDTVTVTVERDGKQLEVPVTLDWHPLELIKPENKDPLSFLLTLQHLDDRVLQPPEETVAVGSELKGLSLWTDNWEVVSADHEQVKFRRALSGGLELIKTYRLAQVPQTDQDDVSFPAYHLEFEVELHNAGDQSRKVAYQLDGPNGLPTEGAWYANKISLSSGVAGLRDVVVSYDRQSPYMYNCPAIADNKVDKPLQDHVLTYIGVDAQYFSAVMIPQMAKPTDIWFAKFHPLRVGKANRENLALTNTSCRLISKVEELAPDGRLTHKFQVFAGPKKPDLLAHYGLGELVYYGWFTVIAVPMVKILHFFYFIVHNYGLAIILLTVLVRGSMFPLSRKQALNAQKMQELQPEIKRIQEKYKKDVEGRTKAQQELFRKHNYNPLGGCLVLFIQLPIFIALYRSLMVDVELRQAPLISESLRWCSNLSAPDMLYDWSWLMPVWVNAGRGMFGLGPYLNVLPIVTVVLFNWQQKMMMPPPADEQAAMQQKVMQYMMIFMGLLFYKVASGLCIYFVASSLWGVAERRFLPKTAKPQPAQPQPRNGARR